MPAVRRREGLGVVERVFGELGEAQSRPCSPRTGRSRRPGCSRRPQRRSHRRRSDRPPSPRTNTGALGGDRQCDQAQDEEDSLHRELPTTRLTFPPLGSTAPRSAAVTRPGRRRLPLPSDLPDGAMPLGEQPPRHCELRSAHVRHGAHPGGVDEHRDLVEPRLHDVQPCGRRSSRRGRPLPNPARRPGSCSRSGRSRSDGEKSPCRRSRAPSSTSRRRDRRSRDPACGPR